MYASLNALIVDPDLDSRMRLKHAGSEVYEFAKISLVNSLEEATNRCNGAERIDLVFLSYDFEAAKIGRFISHGKQSTQADAAAFILVTKASKQGSASAATGLGVDADGFLYEPYSVDALHNVIEISAKVRLERSGAKKRAALHLIVKEACEAIDQIAYNEAIGRGSSVARKKLEEIGSRLKPLQEECGEHYFKTLLETLEALPPPKLVPKHMRYQGVSQRVREKMAEADTQKEEAAEKAKSGGRYILRRG